jgi:hypothetical protein
MANAEHLERLKQDVDTWNAWRGRERISEPDLSEAALDREDLSGADLAGAKLIEAKLVGANLIGLSLVEANLVEADLSRAKLRRADLSRAKLIKAKLVGANLVGADLSGVDLSGADLSGANLSGVDLSWVNLSGADLSGANLQQATLVETDLTGANLTDSRIYGISPWGVKLDEDTIQKNLIITSRIEPDITVDNIEVAQFIYLLLYNEKLRNIIDTITSKAVLILGRFTPGRKAVLDVLRDELRKRNRTPIVFDFNGPRSKNTTDMGFGRPPPAIFDASNRRCKRPSRESHSAAPWSIFAGANLDHCLLLICGTNAGMAAVSCGNPQSAVGVGGEQLRRTGAGGSYPLVAALRRRCTPRSAGDKSLRLRFSSISMSLARSASSSGAVKHGMALHPSLRAASSL